MKYPLEGSGKGYDPRPVNKKKYDEGYDKIIWPDRSEQINERTNKREKRRKEWRRVYNE